MNLPKKLWIIEDVEELQPIYRNIFEEDNFALTFFRSFKDFSTNYQDGRDLPDLVIADILLEDGHFFQLLNEADISLDTPFLVISGCDDYHTISSSYQAGAIDYILKPFNQNEIKAKVEKHILTIQEQNYEFNKSLESLNLELSNFTNKEIKIIESFNVKENKTLHRSEIIKLIWKNIAIHPNTLDVHIYNLRKKLKPFNYGIRAIGNGLFRFNELTPREASSQELVK